MYQVPDEEVFYVDGFPFLKPSPILPDIPALKCCNGMHKAVCAGKKFVDAVTLYPQRWLKNKQQVSPQNGLSNQMSIAVRPKEQDFVGQPQAKKPRMEDVKPTQKTVDTSNYRKIFCQNTANVRLGNVVQPKINVQNQPVVVKPKMNGQGGVGVQQISIGKDQALRATIFSTTNNQFGAKQSVQPQVSAQNFAESDPSTRMFMLGTQGEFDAQPSVRPRVNVQKPAEILSESSSHGMMLDVRNKFNAPRVNTASTQSQVQKPAQTMIDPASRLLELEAQKELNARRVLQQRVNTFANQNQNIGNLSDMHGKFMGFLKDSTAQFDNDWLLNPEMREKMYHVLRNTFGFQKFRHCQRAVVIASLLGNDCCVLMPTGAGKSLCYQLTALLTTGLTIVVSPLRSLMMDQIMKLKSLNIPCACLKGDLTAHQRDQIFEQLCAADFTIKLLYVSPEMLFMSNHLKNVLSQLHKNGRLGRLVIDEAHCISSWGHDFRPDYRKLAEYSRDFENPRVPILALTATATPKTVIDMRKNLQIDNSHLFISSFVRSNLRYDLVPKSAASFKKNMETLKEKYPNDSGIVYCLSRLDCEDVSDKLNKMGFVSAPYHANLSDVTREKIQQKWMNNEITVICATIAFGLGIDKPDVRYVVHHSMSSSIEAYYQETGRAGRDGFPAHCILFYAISDHVRYMKLFQHDTSSSTPTYKKFRLQCLYEMLAYCENINVCCRKMLVEHFGEFYDADICRNGLVPCNICENLKSQGVGFKAYDFTTEAIIILKSVKQLYATTLNNIVDLYRGVTKKKKAQDRATWESRLPLFGRGEGCSEDDTQRFVRKLLVDGYLGEKLVKNTYHGVTVEVAHVNVTNAGEQLILKRGPKIFSYLSTAKLKANTSHFYNMPAITDAIVLKEKYKLKNFVVFHQAKREFKQLFDNIARGQKLCNGIAILSFEGIEQLSAMLPRTKSEILQIDSMTPAKFKAYGARIVTVLQRFWNQLDQLEHRKISRTINEL